ncbi:MAG TPA: tRNA (adenosine(37)-N6)-threonylcarbamoyltransferase complex ATPase subunit type 1 TsaE [Candidatus Binatia bacterium]|nr:tRNA (adenosine(37)-N6)-threonylcarbamoyltransferase complex ATPase subunit type 1 TsaE [Candidatus Binatia bacterium]
MSTAITERVVVVTRTATETIRLGERLGAVAEPGDLVCLFGDLGAGKTQLAKGIARGLGVTGVVNSPSFILVAEHVGRLPFFHVDLYRLTDLGEAIAAGILDERRASGLTVVEWADRIADLLPAARLDIRIEGTADEPRRFSLEAHDPGHRRYCRAAEANGR